MIQIDNRIGSKELHLLFKPYRIPSELTRLEFGDLSWIGNGPDDHPVFIGIERKRLKDFLSSMESGRLSGHQLIGMQNAYHYSYIAIEGIWRGGKDGVIEIPIRGRKWVPLELGSRKFTVSMVDNFTNSISIMLGIPCIFTSKIERTVQWCANCYRWWTGKKWEQHKSVSAKKSNRLPIGLSGKKPPLVARVVMELNGIGADKAMKIAKEFDTIQQLLNSDVNQLIKINGIGKSTAERILMELGIDKGLL